MTERRAASVTPARPSRVCPICGKPSARETHPFCSERCRDRDLNRWLSGGYAIPVVEPGGVDEDGKDEPG